MWEEDELQEGSNDELQEGSSDREKNEALLRASREGRVDDVIKLLEDGADPNHRGDVYFHYSSIHYAAEGGKVDVLRIILNTKKVNVNERGGRGRNPLMITCLKGRVDAMKYLIEEGANIDQVDDDGQTMLHWAVVSGSVETVEECLRWKGIDINAKNKGNESALSRAYELKRWPIVDLLLQQPGIQVEDREKNGELLRACEEGRVDDVIKLLDDGADPNHRDDWYPTYSSIHCTADGGHVDVLRTILNTKKVNVNERDGRGRNPLMIACSNGRLDAMKCLIEEGTNVDQVDNEGWTVLHLAVWSGSVETVEECLRWQGIDINAKDKWNKSALSRAYGRKRWPTVDLLLQQPGIQVEESEEIYALCLFCKTGDTDLFKQILSNGANPHLKNTMGYSAIHYAAEGGVTEILKTLISGKVNVNDCSKLDKSALMIACQNGQVEAARYLVTEGADVYASDHIEWTMLHYAVMSDSLQMVEECIQWSGVNVDCRNADGETPLIIACKYGTSVEVVKRLVDKDASVNSEDIIKQTPLFYAYKNEDVDVSDYLLTQPDIRIDSSSTYISLTKSAEVKRRTGEITGLIYNFRKRGLCIIIKQTDISNVEQKLWAGSDWLKRKSIDMDCSQLEYTFKMLNCDVLVETYFTREDIYRLVTLLPEGYKDEDDPNAPLHNYSFLIFCILSGEGGLYGVDGRPLLVYEDIIRPLSSFPQLQGIPKIFITSSDIGSSFKDPTNPFTLPSDWLITYPNRFGLHHTPDYNGSPFIQLLCKTLQNSEDLDDIREVLIGMREQFKHKFKINIHQEEDPYFVEYKSTLSKKIHFQINNSYKEEDFYNMKSKCLCIIINQKNFRKDDHPAFKDTAKQFSNRDGTDVDSSQLQYTFSLFNCDVVVKNDLTHSEIYSLVRNLSRGNMDTLDDNKKLDKLDNYSCLVFTILTHGEEGKVYGCNGVGVEIYNDIVYKLSSTSCKQLQKKPKIFIIQACQGNRDCYATAADGGALSASAIPDISDFLVVFPTLPGYKAYRHTNEGSYFIQALCKQLQNHGSKKDIREVIRLTSNELSKMNIKIENKVQIAVTTECRFVLPKLFKFILK